jgi:hypothetical protein
MQDKGVGVFAEFPLRALQLWGGDLPARDMTDSNWIFPRSSEGRRMSVVLCFFMSSALPVAAATATDLSVIQAAPPACLVGAGPGARHTECPRGPSDLRWTSPGERARIDAIWPVFPADFSRP